MRGRPPEPLAVLQARGSLHAKYRREDKTIEGEPLSVEDVPAWLSASSRTHWMTIYPVLEEMGVALQCDALALGLLCDAIADYLAVSDDVAKKGRVAINAAGAEYTRPSVKMMQASWLNILKAAQEFGLTPVARGRVKLEPKKPTGIQTRERK